MERINLLPDEAHLGLGERILKRVDREFPRVLAGGVAAVGIVGAVIWMGQAVTLARHRKGLAGLKGEIRILQVESQNREVFGKQLDQVEQELRRQKKLLEWKLEYLTATRSRPRIWATVLEEMRREIPQGVWLTELETGPGGAFRISGGATDEGLVTRFMSSLKGSPHFTNVAFTYTEKDQIGNVPIVRFEVVCRVI